MNHISFVGNSARMLFARLQGKQMRVALSICLLIDSYLIALFLAVM